MGLKGVVNTCENLSSRKYVPDMIKNGEKEAYKQ